MDLFLWNSPRSSLQQNKTNRINKRMTALPNAKSILSRAIDTVSKPYADATATTQETVSRVSSSNFSSIDASNGEIFLNKEIFSSSCLRGGCCSAPLPPSFPLVTIGRMHGKRRTGRNGGLRFGSFGLKSNALGLPSALAHDRDDQLFRGLGRRVWAETARRTFDRLDLGDGRDSSVDGSACLRRRQLEEADRSLWTLLVRIRTHAHTLCERISSWGSLVWPVLR
jgi:hypothetical protein